MAKGSISSIDRQGQGANWAYSVYDPKSNPQAFIGTRTDTNLNQGFLKGWDAAAADYTKSQQAAASSQNMMAEFSRAMAGQQQQMQQQQVDWEAQRRQQQEEAERQAGLSQISSMYGSKFDAAERATSEISAQIAEEMGHAQLIGLDYAVDDVMKQGRINDLFASYWGEGDEGTLTGLTQKWGDAGYKWDLPIVRGDASKVKSTTKTDGAKAGDKVLAKGPKLTPEEDALGSTAILG